jgi:hypothetical protein
MVLPGARSKDDFTIDDAEFIAETVGPAVPFPEWIGDLPATKKDRFVT